jgi:hypothetical protein
MKIEKPLPKTRNGLPRRNYQDLHTPVERHLRELVLEIEQLGADPLLTDAVMLLDKASHKLADWLEGETGNTPSVEPSCSESGSVLTCVYCGHEYPAGTPASGSEVQVLTEHIRICPRHPLRALEKRLHAAEDALRFYADRLMGWKAREYFKAQGIDLPLPPEAVFKPAGSNTTPPGNPD